MFLLDENGLTERQFLQQYDPGDFPRPSVAADIVIFTVADVPGDNYRKLSAKKLQILLIRRAGHPFMGQWALPGGFVRPDETVGQAASRELTEETGVKGGYLEQLYTFSKPGRDPRTWVMSCAHMALMDSTHLKLKAGSDASDAKWFSIRIDSGLMELESDHLNTIKSSDLAFDHGEIIAYALMRLRSKLEYTDLAFQLMPEKFTLTQLQQVYEVILGKPLLKAAFRRKIKDFVLETGQYTQNAGHRPSQIFTHRKDGLNP